MQQIAEPDFRFAGDGGMVVVFGTKITRELYGRIRGFVRAFQTIQPAGIREIVPSYCSVMIYFDVLQTTAAEVRQAARQAFYEARPERQQASRVLHVPVCYEGVMAPDMDYVLRATGLKRPELVALHTASPFFVYMTGFTPGFPYMGELPFSIPRRKILRRMVPPGSVGIGASQTGIYTIEGPGEWWLIGRTPLRIFDASRQLPFLLSAGDYVQFETINIEKYFALREMVENGIYAPVVAVEEVIP